MEEIISSILEAEKHADEIVKSASEQSKNIIINADSSAEKIKADAIVKFKAERKAALLSAEEKAQKEYDAKIAEGEKDAALLVAATEKKIDNIAEKILKEII